jgi:hypothetical protein
VSARYLGDFTPGKTIRGRFNTVRPSSGAPFTLAGTPALAVYKDGGTTESTAGVTLTVDFDSRTGLHTYAIDTSADGTFYSSGSDFTVVLTAGTVDSVSAVGLVVGAFSLANRSALRPTTADRTLLVGASGQADANVTQFGGSAGTFASGRPEVNATHFGGTAVASATVQANVASIAGQAAVAAASVTFPSSIGSSTLDAAGVRTAVGLASANLDTQLGDLPTANENADALLGRNVAGGSSSGRLVKEALYVLRNKVAISAGTMTVYATDDTTSAFTASVTTTAGNPVTAIDPA